MKKIRARTRSCNEVQKQMRQNFNLGKMLREHGLKEFLLLQVLPAEGRMSPQLKKNLRVNQVLFHCWTYHSRQFSQQIYYDSKYTPCPSVAICISLISNRTRPSQVSSRMTTSYEMQRFLRGLLASVKAL